MSGSDLTKDFFISYSKADCKWAEWVAWVLEEEGYTTILQAWDFRPGENFIIKMNQAAKQASRTIAILSPEYLDSNYTQSEWAAAFARDPTGERRYLVPVQIRECDLQGLLPQVIPINLVGLEEQAAKEKLLAGVPYRRVKPTKKPDFPGTTDRSVAERPVFPGRAKGHSRKLLYTIIIAVVIAFVLGYIFFAPRDLDCGDIRTACLRLDLATGANQQKCFDEDGEGEITQEDIYKLRSLSGKAILPIPAQESNCPCEWRWGTNKSALEKDSSGNKCIFSFNLPDGVKYIYLNLIVGKQIKIFTIHVRNSNGT